MSPNPLRVLVSANLSPALAADLARSPFGSFVIEPVADHGLVAELLSQASFDALILDTASQPAAPGQVEAWAAEHAVLLVDATLTPDDVFEWFERGVQDVLVPADLAGPAVAQRLRAAIERKRHEREARKAYATDLRTGLPHQQQLVEHMSHLLALREREPAPMALLVLRIEGLATTQARLGPLAAQSLRRKIGVRLRAGVRASDVVASLADDSFGVLLASILVPEDAPRVGAKLLAALRAPVAVGGQDVAVAAALGIAQYPQDGTQPDVLLRRAAGLAAAASAQGRAGFANFQETPGPIPDAANDA
jgi:PleD family two-component response regulator